MSPGEKLDPLPDPFILQPPVFHPVSSHSGLEPPGLSPPPHRSPTPAGLTLLPGGGWRGLGSWARLPRHLLMDLEGPPELSGVAEQLIPTWVRMMGSQGPYILKVIEPGVRAVLLMPGGGLGGSGATV